MNRREFLAAGAALSLCRICGAEAPKDSRPLKALNDYFPFQVPKTLEDWQARRERIREQLLVANGLWPMPERPAAHGVAHWNIERDDYKIMNVYFASRPGHYVTGNLYVPKKLQGKHPAILFAHGHWAKGRFMETPEKEIEKDLASGAERTKESAKYHMQALCSTLARRGYFVFAYDMIGYADSTAIPHDAKAWNDAEATLRLQSLMGLQTWNTLRSIDFLLTLPEVDPKRIGMTGASGGGTQTFIAAALDERIACAVPAVMVSTAMQGGCVCENCSLLRVGTGNVEFAAMMAPRPMALTAANDWTKDIMTKGYPELQKLYALYGKQENVQAKAWLEYGHNYNQKAREFMYSWFAKHLEGKDEEVKEPDFTPVPPNELRVFDEKHPRPKAELKADLLREELIADGRRDLAENREKLVAKALRAMVCDELPKSIAVREGPKSSKVDGCTVHRAWLGRKDEKDALPTAGVFSAKFNGSKAVLWIHPDGKESLFKDDKIVPAARHLIDAGYAVISGDLYGTGDLKLAKPFAVDPKFAGYTLGYNRSVLAQRVHDILTLVAFAQTMLKATDLRLVGWGKAGPWATIAATMTGRLLAGVALDQNAFEFSAIKDQNDEMMLPGGTKYGGMKMFRTMVEAEVKNLFNVEDTKSTPNEMDVVAKLITIIPK